MEYPFVLDVQEAMKEGAPQLHEKYPNVRPDPGITIKYNGSVRQLTDANGKPVYPISYNGTTYIAVRGVAGLFGKRVSWNQATRTVVIEDAMRDITASDLVADIKTGTNHYRALSGIDWSRKVGYYDYFDPINGLDKVSYLTLWGEGLTPFVPAQFAGERRVDMEFYDLERFAKVIQAFKDAGYNAVRLSGFLLGGRPLGG